MAIIHTFQSYPLKNIGIEGKYLMKTFLINDRRTSSSCMKFCHDKCTDEMGTFCAP